LELFFLVSWSPMRGVLTTKLVSSNWIDTSAFKHMKESA
jgi:hypothetical protein